MHNLWTEAVRDWCSVVCKRPVSPLSLLLYVRSRDSSVSIGTRLQDRLSKNSLLGRRVCASPDYPLRPGIHQSSSSMGTEALFPRFKRSEPKVNHLAPCNAEAKNEWSCTLTSLYAVTNGVRNDSAATVPSLRWTSSWCGTNTAKPDFVYCESHLQICQVTPVAVSCASCLIILSEVPSEPRIVYVGPSVTLLTTGYLRWAYLGFVTDNVNVYHQLRGTGSFLRNWLSLIYSRSISPFMEYEDWFPLYWGPHKTLPRVSWIQHAVPL